MPRIRGQTSPNRKVSPWGHHIGAQFRVFGPRVVVSYREPLLATYQPFGDQLFPLDIMAA